MHLRFRQVRYFAEIVEAGSITPAAERLGLAPTALSLQIKKLEEQFGVALLERHARGVSPTLRGREFYDCARRILGLLDETEQLLGRKGGAATCCRLGLSPSLLHAIEPATLFPRPGGSEGPAVELVEGLSGQLIDRLEAGDIDFVLGWVGPHPPSVRVIDLAEEAIVFVTSRPVEAPGGVVGLEEALSSDLIRIGRRSMSWDLVCHRAALAGLSMTSLRVVESADLVRRMLREGLGTAILPVTFVDPERRAGDIHVYKLAGEPLTRRLSLAWREPGPRSGLERGIVAYIEQIMRALHALTAPYCHVLAPIAEALPLAAVQPAGARLR